MDKHKLLAIEDLPVGKVETPEWKPDFPFVCIRTLTAPEVMAFTKSLEGEDGNQDTSEFLQRFSALVLCDEKGERLFDDSDADAVALGKKNMTVLQRICHEAQVHNKMIQDEDAGKNSPQPGDSSSS